MGNVWGLTLSTRSRSALKKTNNVEACHKKEKNVCVTKKLKHATQKPSQRMRKNENKGSHFVKALA